jgi:hypothetical protein
MAYSTSIQEYEDYIRIEVSGEWSPHHEADDAKAVWTHVIDVCRAKGFNRILSVWKVPGHLPVTAAYDIASAGETQGLGRCFRLAVVHLYEERLKDSLFVETVAANRGYKVKMFANEQEAKKWLLEE